MIIVPGSSILQETRHSRELGRRIDQVVREYQREHPDASLSDVRVALTQMTPGGAGPDAGRRRRAAGIVAGALVAGAFAAMAASGGTGFQNTPMTWWVAGAVAAACGVAFVVIRTIRRS